MAQKSLSKSGLRTRRHKRIRARVKGTATRPRLAVYRSNRTMYAQLIDDDAGVTLASARGKAGKTLMEQSREVGSTVALSAQKLGLTKVVFDRGGFTYTGRVRALAEAAREGGLTF